MYAGLAEGVSYIGVLEVNMSPALAADSAVDDLVKLPLIRDTVNVLRSQIVSAGQHRHGLKPPDQNLDWRQRSIYCCTPH